MSNVQTIRLPLRFDFGYHATFSKDYEGLINNPSVLTIELDFSMVQYLDSSALGMLVLLYKKNVMKKQLVIKGAQGTALDILKMANMQNLYAFN